VNGNVNWSLYPSRLGTLPGHTPLQAGRKAHLLQSSTAVFPGGTDSLRPRLPQVHVKENVNWTLYPSRLGTLPGRTPLKVGRKGHFSWQLLFSMEGR
jgi:hypothetical protein